MHRAPRVTDVRCRKVCEVVRLHDAAAPVRLRIPGGHAVAAGERREPVVMVERTVFLHVDHDVLDGDATGEAAGSFESPRRGEPWHRQARDSERPGPFEHVATSDSVVENRWSVTAHFSSWNESLGPFSQ